MSFERSLAAAFAVLIATAATGWAAEPTDAQKAAIKSECRADYIAHCAGVPPGGLPALQCLQTNMSKLSSACQAAVKAVTGG
ncbi:MAG TPA: hypothetical protein PKA74_12515 [Bauldia sp.]|mgnify:CR=1 FL=1|nr:hypothetical protein [Bauldia sp.]